MYLHTLTPNRGSTSTRKRVARGNGSGTGSTAGRGTKGQQSRTGKGKRLGFEGGQTPLIRRQPKIGGFKRPMRTHYQIVNIQDLETLPAGAYDLKALKAAGLASSNAPIKILGMGAVTKKFELTVAAASASAKEAVSKAGGSITIAK